MVIIWGYTPANTLKKNKKIGGELKEVKQLFSALLFQTGIKGICVNIAKVQKNTSARISLHIDSEKVFEEDFFPEIAQEYFFKLWEEKKADIKIEIVFQIIKGSVELPTSAIGIGMGFLKTGKEFLPTNHLALGLILP